MSKMPNHLGAGGYESIDHSADIGIRVIGRTRAELFAHAAEGLFDTITDLSAILPRTSRTIELEAADVEDLLVAWLSELNFIFQTEQMLFSRFLISAITEHHLEAQIFGEEQNRARHDLHLDVKAVTYHGLVCRKTPQGWEAQVLFDV